MSKLRENIEENYKSALKQKNEVSIRTFRLIKSAIKDKDISLRTKDFKEQLGDDGIIKLLQSLIKQRNESFDMYKKGGRDLLAKNELNEIEIIKTLLPTQIGEKELIELIETIIKQENVESVQDMGKIISILRSKYSGKVDMSIAGKLAKDIIQKG
tara:strand:+ start:164 stop:631 length:468 start_codon:yes stop_codon:yes gene_type:complete